MPTYWDKHSIIHFASFKKHIGLYPGPDAIEYFADDLKGFKTSKGAIQFPYDKALPIPLISKIAKWCYQTETSTVTIEVNPSNINVYTHARMKDGTYYVKVWFDDSND